MIYPCGCINEIDQNSQVARCVKKCNFHVQWSQTHPQADSIEYFTKLDRIRDGIPQNTNLVDELITALSFEDESYLTHGCGKSILEIGPGIGPYIPWFLGAHWNYRTVEPAPFAGEWIRQTFYVPVFSKPIEEYLTLAPEFDCIFAAHVLEHLHDAPAVIRQCFENTIERFYVIVPDDEDPTNPDHYWFFNQGSLHRILEQVGFKNVRSQIHKRVPQESFIYCVAEK